MIPSPTYDFIIMKNNNHQLIRHSQVQTVGIMYNQKKKKKTRGKEDIRIKDSDIQETTLKGSKIG